jgi:cytidylate kinase
MAIITISRGSYSRGSEIAEKVAHRLGYSCISRDLILETSKEFNIPEIRLTRALQDGASILEKFTGRREMYLAFIKATLLEHAQKDNMVYHGLAAHFILRRIKHVLHVRITANTEVRAQLLMEREKVSYEEALWLLKMIDHERKQWGMVLYGIDMGDLSNYDLAINVDKLTVDNAVDTICHAAQWEQFKTTPESQRALDELALAATVKAKLLPLFFDVAVTVRKGTVFVKGKTNLDTEARVREAIQAIADTIPGVSDIKIDLDLTTWSFL